MATRKYTTTKSHQVMKRAREEAGIKNLQSLSEKNEQNGNSKSLPINNCF